MIGIGELVLDANVSALNESLHHQNVSAHRFAAAGNRSSCAAGGSGRNSARRFHQNVRGLDTQFHHHRFISGGSTRQRPNEGLGMSVEDFMRASSKWSDMKIYVFLFFCRRSGRSVNGI